MTAPASIHIEDQNRAEKLYGELHTGNIFLGYLCLLQLLTVTLTVRTFLQVIHVVTFEDPPIVKFGQAVAFILIFAESVWLLIRARREDIKLLEYRPYLIDLGLDSFALFMYLIDFAAGHGLLGSLVDFIWLAPLCIRHSLLLKKILLGETILSGLLPQP